MFTILHQKRLRTLSYISGSIHILGSSPSRIVSLTAGKAALHNFKCPVFWGEEPFLGYARTPGLFHGKHLQFSVRMVTCGH